MFVVTALYAASASSGRMELYIVTLYNYYAVYIDAAAVVGLCVDDKDAMLMSRLGTEPICAL